MSSVDNSSSSQNNSSEEKGEIGGSIPINLANIWNQISNIKDRIEDCGLPITVLGKVYESKEQFLREVHSKLCLTYRVGFEPIAKAEDGPSPLAFLSSRIFNRNTMFSNISNIPLLLDSENYTSDVGWGCMIRTSQSLLANAYLRMVLGRGFTLEADKYAPQHTKIVELFKDDTSSPFSLHNFIDVAAGSPLKVKPGQWFGPNAASISIQRLCDRINERNYTDLPKIKTSISESCDVYDSEITEIFDSKQYDGILILFPIRLGIDIVNSFYHPSLLQLLSLEQSIGIAGGKPSSSFYFIGFQDKNLIYLDPHHAQGYSPETDLDSYHTTNYQMLSIDHLDPSMLIGILVENQNDYEMFKKHCVENGNRIVHFHSSNKSLSLGHSVNRGVDTYSILEGDSQDADGFVDLSTESKTVDDFVDLSADVKEYDSEQNTKAELKDRASENNESMLHMSADSIAQSISNDKANEYTDVAQSISDNYEYIGST